MTITDIRADHEFNDIQWPYVGADQDHDGSQEDVVAHQHDAAVANFPVGQLKHDDHSVLADGNCLGNGLAATNDSAPEARLASLLFDPFLQLAADVLDDAESTRIANENRLRQLTRTELDSDGEDRGLGLPVDHPDAMRLSSIVDALIKVEHEAELNLCRMMRRHPLGPWCKAQRGVGEKQAARLLSSIGDPYWNSLHDRPRTVSELWAYCGLHTLSASGAHDAYDTQTGFAAARRTKGQKSNWSSKAKSRAWLIAVAMLKNGNREVYDARKAATEGRLHAAPCVRCGPSGSPAAVGTPWSDGHRHADALRVTSKALLRDLWRESKRIHETRAAA